jgi:hypothetical protein
MGKQPKTENTLNASIAMLKRTATWAMLVVSTSQLTSCGYYLMNSEQPALPLPEDVVNGLSVRGSVSLDEETLNEILTDDPSAKPLQGWSIRLASAMGSPLVYSTGSLLVAFTDENGEFEIPSVPQNNYRLIALPPPDFVPLFDPDGDLDGVIDGSFLGAFEADSREVKFEFTKKIASTTLAPDCLPSCYRISGTIYMNPTVDVDKELSHGDSLLEGLEVELYYGPWGSRVEGSRVLDGDGYPVRAVTNHEGRYEFLVGADSYKVVLAPPKTGVAVDWEFGSDSFLDGAINVNLVDAHIDHVNIGLRSADVLDDFESQIFETTAEPVTTSPGPSTTPEVSSTTEEPTTTFEATSTTEEPTTTSEATSTTEEPTTTSGPTSTTEEPTTTSEATSTTEEPTTTSGPTSTTEEPTTTSGPTSTTEEPTTTSEATSTTEEPTTTSEATSTTEEPTTTSEATSTTEEPTTTSGPTSTTEEPTTTSGPTSTTEEPTTTSGPTSTTEEPTTTSGF